MPGLLTIEQHGTTSQIQPLQAELTPDARVTPCITKLQLRQPTRQLGTQRKVPAKGAGAVVNKLQAHAAIMEKRRDG